MVEIRIKINREENILEAKPREPTDELYMGLAERDKKELLNFRLNQLPIFRYHFLYQRGTEGRSDLAHKSKRPFLDVQS